MAVQLGQPLPTPEPGWKRYDDRNCAIQYIGTWLYASTLSAYSGGLTYTRTVGDRIKFSFKGTKIRIINHINVNNSDRIKIVIDDIIVDYINLSQIATHVGNIFNCLVYEKTSLEDRVHTVEIIVENSSAGWLFELDAIDIDDTGRLFHPDEVTDIKDLDIGKRIRCHYHAPTSGQVGIFSGLGEETSDFIPPTSSTTPNGDFYFICVDRDYLGRLKLIADRNIQSGISWDTLNSEGIASGSGLPLNDDTAVVISTKANETESRSVSNLTSIEFQDTPYIAYTAIGSDGYLDLFVRRLSGNRWELVGGGPINTDTGISHARENSMAVYNNELYVAWKDDNSGGKIRVKKFNGVSWVLVDEGGLNNGGPGYPTMAVYKNELYVFWYEWNGSAREIKGKKYNGIYWTDLNGGNNLVSTVNYTEYKLSAIVFNDELYLFYCYDRNVINSNNILLKVVKFDGISWTDPLNGSSLNIDTSKRAVDVSTEIFNNELYVAWSENHSSSSYYIVLKKFDGLNWSLVNDHVNYTTNSSGMPYLKVHDNKLYVFFTEYNGQYTGAYYRYFDGVKWFNNNKTVNVSTNNSSLPTMVSINGELYLFWREVNNLISIKMSKLFDIYKIKLTLRLITGGISSGDKDNEWDQYIVNSDLNGTITPGDNNVWNWNGVLSWTSTTGLSSNHRVERGYSNLTNHVMNISNTLRAIDGFRPVLLIEIIKQKHNFSGNIDKNVVHKDSVTLSGTLSALDGYAVSYQILLNDQVIYEVGDFLPTHDINITIPSDNMVLGSNVIKLVAIDNTGDSSSYWIFNVSKVNTIPFITASMQGLTLNIRIDDPDTDNVKFRIELNGNQVFPPSGYTNFRTPPVLYKHTFKSSDVNIGSSNTLVIYAVDDLGSETAHQLEFIGEYSGLMFADSDGNYYSTDLGEVLKYLDFGGVIAGQTTLSVPIRLINKNGFKVTNIVLSNDNNTQPPGVRLEMSKSDLPFTPETELFYPIVLNHGDEITFYVRLATDAGTPPKSGKVTIFVKGDPIE